MQRSGRAVSPGSQRAAAAIRGRPRRGAEANRRSAGCQGLLEQPWQRRLVLAAIAILAAVLYAWAIGQDTLEYYYAAADRSMAMSWHNFFFGAFDPAGTITVDKLPGALWLQALSVRAFGVHAWAIVLPQVIEGILTVLVLYRAVSRLAGHAAGLIAALVLAVSPATVALNRENISDSLLILLLVLAADAVSAAIAGTRPATGRDADTGDPEQSRPPGRSWRPGPTTGRLLLAGLWVGLAFQAKEIEAWMVLPAFGLAYLLAAPAPAARRAAQLGVAAAVVAVVSLSWMTVVSLVPAHDRPYVDGSHNDSVYEQVFSYNGFGRFGNQTPLQVRATQIDPGAALPVAPRGPDRMLRSRLGRDIGWLVPAAAAIAVWGLVTRRRQRRGDPLRASLVLWGGWLLAFFAVFSVVTVLQPYYTAALSPAIAAIIGTGVAAATSRDRVPVGWITGLAGLVAITAAYGAWLVSSAPGAPRWLAPVIIVAGLGVTALVLWSATGSSPVPFPAAAAAGLAAMLLAPAAASVAVAASGEGAFDAPFELSQVRQDVIAGSGELAVANLKAHPPFWLNISPSTPDVLAAQGIGLPSVIIYATGREALPIGGFDGTTPSPTLAQLKDDIRRGVFRYVWITSPADLRLQWIAAHCSRLPSPGPPTPAGRSSVQGSTVEVETGDLASPGSGPSSSLPAGTVLEPAPAGSGTSGPSTAALYSCVPADAG
jgi:4-amino-4-deoxy-L-arabinose transferase-like glycosyltransferase